MDETPPHASDRDGVLSADERFVALCLRMQAGELDEPAARDLAAQLESSADNRRVYVYLAQHAQFVYELFEQSATGMDEGPSPRLHDLLSHAAEHTAVPAPSADRPGPPRVGGEGVGVPDPTEQESVSRLLDRLIQVEATAQAKPVDLTEALLSDRARRARPASSWARRGPNSDQPRVVVIPKSVFWGAIAAVVVILVFLVRPEKPQPQQSASVDPPPMPAEPVQAPLAVAALLDEYRAVWAGGRSPVPREALTPGQYELRSGLARLRFDSEAVTIIEAPAVFSIDTQAQLTLMSGKAATLCETPRSKGFVVQTPSARVTDLGTAFSVEYWPGERTRAQVMTGRIALRAAADAAAVQPVNLSTGQAVEVADGSAHVAFVPYEADRASTDWERVVRRPELTGSVRYALSVPPSARVGELEDAHEILLLLERIDARLEQDLVVSFTEPGRYAQAPPGLMQTLARGTAVDSYLLHMDTPGSSDTATRLSATITFDRPILGVIIHGSRITASDPVLGHPDTAYEAAFSGASVHDARGFDVTNDLAVLSEDRKTLTVHLLTSTSLDQVRILVEPRREGTP